MEFKISERDDDYKKSPEPVTGTPPFLITVCRPGTERSRDNPLPGEWSEICWTQSAVQCTTLLSISTTLITEIKEHP